MPLGLRSLPGGGGALVVDGTERVRVNAAGDIIEVFAGGVWQPVWDGENAPFVGLMTRANGTVSGTALSFDIPFGFTSNRLFLLNGQLISDGGSSNRAFSANIVIGGGAAGQRVVANLASAGFGTNRLSGISVLGDGFRVTATVEAFHQVNWQIWSLR